jgi:hypothetical protein
MNVRPKLDVTLDLPRGQIHDSFMKDVLILRQTRHNTMMPIWFLPLSGCNKQRKPDALVEKGICRCQKLLDKARASLWVAR